MGATSTRSRLRSRASLRASWRGRTPNCSPSSPMTRTSRARIRSLTRRSLLIGCHLVWFQEIQARGPRCTLGVCSTTRSFRRPVCTIPCATRSRQSPLRLDNPSTWRRIPSRRHQPGGPSGHAVPGSRLRAGGAGRRARPTPAEQSRHRPSSAAAPSASRRVAVDRRGFRTGNRPSASRTS